ncbi:MAG TPA: AI-2E family transporter [Fluviicoccus sp.]|nr:AI-2E family transporter [Fluviicoccus sp.]
MNTSLEGPDIIDPDDLPEPPPIVMDVPAGIRSVSLVVLAVLAGLYAVHWAAEFLIPVVLSLMCSYTLSPVVDLMVRQRIPRALAAALVLLGLIGGTGMAVYSLSDDAADLIGALPEAAQKVRESLQRDRHNNVGPMAMLQKAAKQIEQATEEAGPAVPAGKGVTRVQIEHAKFNISSYFWSGTLGLFAMAGQVLIVCFTTYFLLTSGDTFRRKIVRIAGPTFSRRKITVQVLDEITRQIQRYLMVQVLTSVMVGVATWLAFRAIGLEHAAVMGLIAGVLDLVPYIGMVIVTVVSGLMGFLQFDSLNMALLVGGLSLLIHGIEGYVLFPWLTSRASRMNPVAVFVGMLGWGWLWGFWGLLLGLPILMSIKVICDHVEGLKPVGELLGD